MGSKQARCLIIAGGTPLPPADMRAAVEADDCVICADAGYRHALAAGIRPDLLVGDFDSLKAPLPQDVEIIRLPARKDDTDLHFAAAEGLRRGFRSFLLLAAAGSRPDHNLAAYATMLFLKEHGGSVRLLAPGYSAQLVREETLVLSGPFSGYVSLFAFGGPAAGVTLRGFSYPLDDYDMQPSFPIGISNLMVENSASVTVAQGAVLLLMVDQALL